MYVSSCVVFYYVYTYRYILCNQHRLFCCVLWFYFVVTILVLDDNNYFQYMR